MRSEGEFMTDGGPTVILASKSPVRASLLHGAGVAFAVEAAAIDEHGVRDSLHAAGADTAQTAEALAELKAMRVSHRHPGVLVIGADQILDCDGAWFDKPGDAATARRDLQALRAKMHMQISAVCVALDGTTLWRHNERARLVMRDFSDGFLETYLAAAGDEILECAGGYRVEGLGVQLFARIEGDYFTILGLPLVPLLDFLRERGAIAT